MADGRGGLLAGREDGVEGVLAAHREVVEGFGQEAEAAVPGDVDVVHDGVVGRRVADAAGVLAQAGVAGWWFGG